MPGRVIGHMYSHSYWCSCCGLMQGKGRGVLCVSLACSCVVPLHGKKGSMLPAIMLLAREGRLGSARAGLPAQPPPYLPGVGAHGSLHHLAKHACALGVQDTVLR